MKTRSKTGRRQFQLRLIYGVSYYIECIARLEKLIAAKPRKLQIDLIGAGEIPTDMALLIRSILRGRSPGTHLVTNARSSLQGGSLLVWLLGDTRRIRDDAMVYIKPNPLSEDDIKECSECGDHREPKFRDSFSEIDPDDIEYLRLLELINEFLPVRELAGRRIGAATLRQYGLIESEKRDQFLACAFANDTRLERSPNATPARRTSRKAKARVPGQSGK
jgi:hypothetical protein